ncbi:MAG: DUF4140 domain-containing protein, partial [Bacteroidota bacterium]
MKKIFLSLLIISSFNTTILANGMDVVSKVESVTIYHSGALVNRTSIVDLKPGINELVFKNLSSKLILSSLKISNKEVT